MSSDLIAQPVEKPAVYSSIIGVMEAVTNVPKTGEMTNRKGEHQYNFVKSADLRAKVGRAFRDQALMLQSRDCTAVFETKPVSGANGQTLWTTAQVTITYVFTSLVDGSTLEFQSAGEGRDSSDKATAKAMTMALKSALSQAFMIATDEQDPDAERPEIHQDQRYAPAPPDNRTPEQIAAQKAYEERRAAQRGDQPAAPQGGGQRLELTADGRQVAAQAQQGARLAQDVPPQSATRLAARRPGETDQQYLERLRQEQGTQEDYNAAVADANGRRAAQVHPAQPTQADAPTGDPMADAERMLADQLGARPVDEVGQILVTAIGAATRERIASGRPLAPRDTAQRERAGRAVAAAVNARDLDQIDRIVRQADQEGLLGLTIDDGKMVGAMIKAMRDSRLAGASS